MKKLMSKSVLLGFGALLAVSLNTSLCTKTASASLNEDENQYLRNLALKEANGNPEYAGELYELEKNTIEDIMNLNPTYSEEERKNIEDTINATLEKHKKENGGQGRTPEQNAELIKMVYKFYGNEDQDKAMENYFEESQEIEDKYSQNPQ